MSVYRERHAFQPYRERAHRINEYYGFGARIIVRMLAAEYGVNVPFYTVQAWLKRT